MPPVAVLLVAVLIAAWWWIYGVEPKGREIGYALVVLVALGVSWPELVPALVTGAPLGFAAGLGTRLWPERWTR